MIRIVIKTTIDSFPQKRKNIVDNRYKNSDASVSNVFLPPDRILYTLSRNICSNTLLISIMPIVDLHASVSASLAGKKIKSNNIRISK